MTTHNKNTLKNTGEEAAGASSHVSSSAEGQANDNTSSGPKRSQVWLRAKFDMAPRIVAVDSLPDYEKLREAFGDVDFDFLLATLAQLAEACPRRSTAEIDRDLNCMRTIIEGIGPRDQIESLLAIQMAVLHVRAMYHARHAAMTKYVDELESSSRLSEKAMQAFAKHAETLQRRRTKGKQTVVVQHVHVADGGQAIVGNVKTRTARKNKSRKNKSQQPTSHRPTYPKMKTMKDAGSKTAYPELKHPTIDETDPPEVGQPSVEPSGAQTPPLASPTARPFDGEILPPVRDPIPVVRTRKA